MTEITYVFAVWDDIKLGEFRYWRVLGQVAGFSLVQKGAGALCMGKATNSDIREKS